MRSETFRFRPPPRQLAAEPHWVLVRAFAPPSIAVPAPPDGLGAVRWAEWLGLAPRIAHRLARATLAAELGDELAADLEGRRHRAVACTMLLERLLEKVLDRSQALRIPTIVIKGMALLSAGISPHGSRPVADLDLLVAEERAARLAAALRDIGLQPIGEKEAHHLQPLADPELGQVELHRSLPGVGLGHSSAATLGALQDHRQVCTLPGRPDLEVPSTPVLTGHALAHALDQHGFSPHAYPVTRLLADLVDLAAAATTSVDALVEAARPLVSTTLSARELRAVVTLCRDLTSESCQASPGDSEALLGHCLAAATSRRYRQQLRARAALRAARQGRWGKFRLGLRPSRAT